MYIQFVNILIPVLLTQKPRSNIRNGKIGTVTTQEKQKEILTWQGLKSLLKKQRR